MKTNKMPVNITIEFGFDISPRPDRISIQPNGDIYCYSNGDVIYPKRAYRMVYRERNSCSKKPKVISQIPVCSSNLNCNGVVGAVTQYDFVYAIDTNRVSYEGKNIHVSCFIAIKFVKKSNGVAPLPDGRIRIIEFENILSESPENVAWQHLIEEIQDDSKRIGIVVDSDLANIREYNEKTKPIINDFYLPDNIDLIYASADSGSEITNRMIRIVDSCSKKFTKELSEGSVARGEFKSVRNKPYSGFRFYFSRDTIESDSQVLLQGTIPPPGAKISLYAKK